jgi:WD40 repeat protein
MSSPLLRKGGGASPVRAWLAALLLVVLPSIGGCNGDARAVEASTGRPYSMFDAHTVLGEDLQRYAHSDPNPIRFPLTRSLVRKIVWSPDGTRLVSLADASDELILWDVIGGKTIRKIPLEFPLAPWPGSIAFTADGKSIVMFGIPGSPQDSLPASFSVIDGLTGQNLHHIAGPEIDGRPSHLRLVTVPKSGNTAAMLFGTQSGDALFLYDTTKWEPVDRVYSLVGRRVPEYEHDMAISPDGRHLAMLKTVRREEPVKNDPTHKLTIPVKTSQLVIWDIAEHRPVVSTMINEDSSNAWAAFVRYSPDGSYVAVGLDNSWHRSVRIFDAMNGSMVRVYAPPVPDPDNSWWAVKGLSWSPDGSHIAVCGEHNSLRILDAVSSAVVDSIETPGPCWAVAFSPDGTRIAYGSDNTVIIRKILTKH